MLLEVEINKHKKQLKAVVIDLNSIDIFLEYDWLVKHNPEVNWKDGKIWFTRCPRFCKMKHQDIEFKTRRTQVMETIEKDNSEIDWRIGQNEPRRSTRVYSTLHVSIQ